MVGSSSVAVGLAEAGANVKAMNIDDRITDSISALVPIFVFPLTLIHLIY
jgi:hypothetical protein